MFEYTSTDIEKRLESLNAASIAFLESLPTFLCSEISRAGDAATMIVKYGKISDTRLERREVTTSFETLIDFGEMAFESVEQAQIAFKAAGFQLYRTHWAVRDGDAQEILAALADIKPEMKDNVAAPLEPDPRAIDIEPPPRTKNILGIANSVETFLGLLSDLPPKDSNETFFRGHQDASFELTPSLLRKWPSGAWKFMPNEDRLCKELLIAHYDEFQGDQYCFDRLVRMQHYGLPTRLLDISGNPLVALFFACLSPSQQEEVEGEVIVFTVASSTMKYYDSDTVSCLSNLSNLTFSQKSEIDLSLMQAEFNSTNAAQKLIHHIRSEKGFFEGRIIPDDLGSIICVKAKRTNSRIKSQSGAFLLFGHEATLPEFGQEGIGVTRITVRNKGHILGQLDRININATTVYPSIDQTATHLLARYLNPALPE